MTDPTVKKQYLFLSQPDKPLWRKASWTAFSLALGGLPTLYLAVKTLDQNAEHEKVRVKERTEDHAALQLVAKANIRIWAQNRERWSWQHQPPVTTGEEAQAFLGSQVGGPK